MHALRRSFITFVSSALTVVGAAAAQQGPPAPEITTLPVAQGPGTIEAQRRAWFADMQVSPGATETEGRLDRARAMVERAVSGRAPRMAVVGDEWASIGPYGFRDEGYVMNGRVLGAAAHPSDPNTIVVFPEDGGVLRSVDGGTSWTRINDGRLSAWIYDSAEPAIAFAVEYPGSRVLRSDDGGVTWRAVWAAAAGETVRTIAMDPRSAGGTGQRILVAATRGLVELSGGGASARLVSRDVVADPVVFNPKNPDQVFATAWHPDGKETDRMFRSLDGGRSWQAMALPASPLRGVVVGAGDPARLYFVRSDGEGAYSLYRSDDLGGSWTRFDAPKESYEAWTYALTPHPTEPLTVYVGGLDVWRSTDGGRAWDSLGVPHVDQTRFLFDAAGRLLVCGDGGVFRRVGAVWFSLGRGYSALQLYRVTLDPDHPTVLYAGSQDNGTLQMRGAAGWGSLSGGDGGGVAIDAPAGLVYSHTQRQDDVGVVIYRCPVSGLQPCTRLVARERGVDAAENMAFIPVLVNDPTAPSNLYLLGSRVYRSTDRGETWAPASPVLATICRDYDGGNLCYPTTFTPYLTAIGFSETTPGVAYVGALLGYVWSTTDGVTWRAGRGLPYRRVSGIVVHPRDASIAYATMAGYNPDKPAPFGKGHVFRTTDGGATWSDVSANLPDVPANDVVIDPDGASVTIYVATDAGVFRLIEGETEWQVFGRGLPAVRVTDLAYSQRTDTLAAATYGRGLFVVSSRYGR